MTEDAMESDEAVLLEKVNEVIRPYGCVATEIGPDSVGVQGDARITGPTVYVKVRAGMEI